LLQAVRGIDAPGLIHWKHAATPHVLPTKFGQTVYRLGLAIVPLCRGTGAPFNEHRRPWPLRNFLTSALRRKILLSLWPLAYAPGRDDY